MHKTISSLQNPLVKQFLQLSGKARERKRSGLFVIEGQREIELALKANYIFRTVLFSSEILAEEALYTLKDLTQTGTQFFEISTGVYDKLAYRASTEGIIAIAEARDFSLESLNFKREHPLLLVAEAPEKPGNIGALLRTADAANVDAVIIANPKTDMYNPNVIRSSVGCVFTNAIASGTTSEIIDFLSSRKIAICCAALKASVPYYDCDFTKSTAIVVGAEAVGLSPEWLMNSTQNIIIPMQGEIDSMNVSVAAGILIFEAKRQRNFQ